jgi:two-component system phosphate regulon sensor histidine kinase PhoR
MLRLRVTSLASSDVPGAILLVRDVTHLSMLERARRDMVASVSHELRTPLASVKLLVETLQSGPPPPIAARMLGQMAQEVDAVTQLVDELHELSQIESGRIALQLAPSALPQVAARAIERIRPQAERKSLSISAYVPDELPLALLDENRIGQVLLNLLHNAVKFTPEGGEIRIEAARVEHASVARGQPAGAKAAGMRHALPGDHSPGDWLLVRVADSGVGIPAQDLPRIFERFYKVDRARTRNAGGTGLGLAIAKHLVEGHSGRIWASSEEGRGTTISFTVPIA